MTEKLSALLPSVSLQPHQERVSDEASETPLRKLLLWGLGSGKCLRGDTIVAFESGVARIDTLFYERPEGKSGDGWSVCPLPTKVVSFQKNRYAYIPVKQIYRETLPSREHTLLITTTKGGVIETTGEHKFRVKASKGLSWEMAGELMPGDLLLVASIDNRPLFEVVDHVKQGKMGGHVYDLMVEADSDDDRNYIAGRHGFVVHNSLGSISAAEAYGAPYSVLVPAALRPNYKKERQKFTDEETPADVMSYSELALGKRPQYPESLVLDEAQRLRNQNSAASQAAIDLAQRAKQVVLLSGTPIVNKPSDFATPMSMLLGRKITPEEFQNRYTTTKVVRPGFFGRLMGVPPGEEEDIANKEELKNLLQGKIDYYSPDKPVVPVNREEHIVEMGPEQSSLYQAMFDKLPFWTRWKLQHDFPLSRQELLKMQSFLSGPRMVSLSTYPFLKDKDPLKAFSQSPKLQKAMELLKEQLKDPRKKGLIFSNFVDAGLMPYSAALTREGIPNAVFHGGLNDKARQQLVEDYNQGRLRAALIGPSGTEGLSFKGTSVQQLLDPHFQGVRGRQAEGRGLRFDSHSDLPEDMQNMLIQRFVSKLPPHLLGRFARRLGIGGKSRPAVDDYLKAMTERKDKLNDKFMDVLRQIGREG